MSRKIKIAAIVGGLLVVAVAVGAPRLIRWRHRRQAEWWLEHHYPVVTSLMPPEQQHFRSYDEWSQAGQAIAGIDEILREMYLEASSADERSLLLYAMGAVPGPTTIEFLADVVRSSEQEGLRDVALIHGLLCNLYTSRTEMVQPALVEYVRDPQQSISYRCSVLADLIEIGNKDAVDYGRQHGQRLVEEGKAASVHARTIDYLRERLSLVGPAS